MLVMRPAGLAIVMVAALAITTARAAADDPQPARERELVRLVRQDCGACHGMTLQGGLGPALLPDALRDKPVESLRATILRGRPGTAMPPWQAMLSEKEADWIVKYLLAGFPHEVAR
jgi:cytochrome c55X